MSQWSVRATYLVLKHPLVRSKEVEKHSQSLSDYMAVCYDHQNLIMKKSSNEGRFLKLHLLHIETCCHDKCLVIDSLVP